MKTSPSEKRERHNVHARASYYRHHAENKERKRAYQLARYQDPEKRARIRLYMLDYNKRPEVKARIAKGDKRPERVTKRRDGRRAKRSGIGPQMFHALLMIQKGKCAICNATFVGMPNADHDHDNQKPRGLLCRWCNVAEGYIKKTGLTPTGFAQRLEQYLANPPANEFQETGDEK
jgi:hypothetical protein